MNAEAPSFDPVRILEALHRHGVEYLVVGGVAGQAHGATRATNDLDCVPRSTKENLQRLAVAMRELGARLRVEGMSDDEARQLPVQLDSEMLDRLRVSTWITDAGLFDVLMDIPDRQGGRRDYTDLAARSEVQWRSTIRVGTLRIITVPCETYRDSLSGFLGAPHGRLTSRDHQTRRRRCPHHRVHRPRHRTYPDRRHTRTHPPDGDTAPP